MAPTVKTHSFRGRRFAVNLNAAFPDDTKTNGEADAPRMKAREIRMRKGLSGLMCLDTLVHEALHACLWDIDEEAVRESAGDIARLLWRLGYRRGKV